MGYQRDADEAYTLLTQYFAEFNERLSKGDN
jgi:hypothetical protein